MTRADDHQDVAARAARMLWRPCRSTSPPPPPHPRSPRAAAARAPRLARCHNEDTVAPRSCPPPARSSPIGRAVRRLASRGREAVRRREAPTSAMREYGLFVGTFEGLG